MERCLVQAYACGRTTPLPMEKRCLQLLLEKFEVGGLLVESPHAPIELAGVGSECRFGCTVFFAAQMSSEPVAGSRLAASLDFMEIDGKDFRDDIKAGRASRTNKFSSHELAELSRRTGLPLKRYTQALGGLEDCRFHHGLLQKRCYMNALGIHDYLTVIPDGGWRTTESPTGERRRLTLRRYILLLFHCAAVGPHKGVTKTAASGDRCRTLVAISEARCSSFDQELSGL